MAIALSLEAIRRDRGMTQEQVAKALGVGVAKYLAWEMLTQDDLQKIASLYNVEVKDIRIPR